MVTAFNGSADGSVDPALYISALATFTGRCNRHADEGVDWALSLAAASTRKALSNAIISPSGLAGALALCGLQRPLPLPARQRPTLSSRQGLGLPADNQVDDHDQELFQHGHDDEDSDRAVDEAEVVIMEEDGKQGVDDTDEDEGERDDDGKREALFTGVGGEPGDDDDGADGQDDISDDVKEDADLGRGLDGEGAVGGHAIRAADNAEDEAERDDQLREAELEHVECVGSVRVERVHTARKKAERREQQRRDANRV